jgi:hypothetical protein
VFQAYMSMKSGMVIWRAVFERTRTPIIPIWGGFPVKLITHIGKSWFLTIDMRRLSRLPPPPLLPVISCSIDSALLYIMVAGNRNAIWPPPPQLSHHRRAALSTIQMGHSLHIRERARRGAVLKLLSCLLFLLKFRFAKFRVAYTKFH